MFDGFIKIVEIYTVFLFKLIKYRSCQIKQLPSRDHNLTSSHEKNTTDTSSVNLIKIRPLTCFTASLMDKFDCGLFYLTTNTMPYSWYFQ
jgi:hypothetical protein